MANALPFWRYVMPEHMKRAVSCLNRFKGLLARSPVLIVDMSLKKYTQIVYVVLRHD